MSTARNSSLLTYLPSTRSTTVSGPERISPIGPHRNAQNPAAQGILLEEHDHGQDAGGGAGAEHLDGRPGDDLDAGPQARPRRLDHARGRGLVGRRLRADHVHHAVDELAERAVTVADHPRL